MRFKDRRDAGERLGALLLKELYQYNPKDISVISLLRGGIVVGYEVAKILHASHIPLVVSKVSAPQSAELAIGAVCYYITYLDRSIIEYLGGIPRPLLRHQIEDAQMQFEDYIARYDLRKINYKKALQKKIVVIVDDGVATGASVKAASLFINTFTPRQIYIASPIVSGALDVHNISVISLIPNAVAGSISEFYDSFLQVGDDEVMMLLKSS